MEYNFPKEFLWGSATSAHQVEGGNFNDWTEWEKKNAERFAKEAKNKWQPWQQEKFPEMFEPENYISGRACDHYNRYEQDFDIVKQLGHNAHRFSIEWSRVEPEEGKFNEAEIEHYRKVILALKARGLEPFVTLWHWTMPVWLAGIGGWANKKTVEYFVRYALYVAQAFPEVKFWITLNETNVRTSLGYLLGCWPPGKKSLIQYFIANHHLSRAHINFYKGIKEINKSVKIGVAYNAIYFTKFPAGLKRCVANHLFLDSIRNHQDFIGLNYYHSDRETGEKSEFLNWSIDPVGFYSVLKDMSKYKRPIYITENGIADAKDEKRTKFIKDHLEQAGRAINDGVDVRGYFYWSLLDNFEWDKGFWPRFGLVEIDYQTLERKIRPSAWEYTKICKENRLLTL